MNILIAYYSRTGTTKKVAETLAQKLGADTEEIKDTVKRSGIIGYLKSGRDGMKKLQTTLQPLQKNPADYDLVIVGTPIWVNASSPVRTYLTQNLGKFKQVAFFCTMGGKNNHYKAFAEMEKITGQKPLATLALRAKEVARNNFEGKMNDFVKILGK